MRLAERQRAGQRTQIRARMVRAANWERGSCVGCEDRVDFGSTFSERKGKVTVNSRYRWQGKWRDREGNIGD